MAAFNIVRFRVKPGREQHFLDAHRQAQADFTGLRRASLVHTGERAYCLVGEWERFDDIVNARERMLPILDGFREDLEDLGGGLGVTDPVSGEEVVRLR